VHQSCKLFLRSFKFYVIIANYKELFMKRKFKYLSLILALLAVFTVNFNVSAQADVARKTVAVTYPLGEEINVFFKGTTRFPRLKGTARVLRKNKTGTKIDLSLENLPRPFELGAAYTTYVLWAITPEGRADNLGELKYRSGTVFQNPKVSVTTPLQTFALIVTAEPHFLVKEPSRGVILENVQPASNVANIVNAQYLGNSSDYFRDPRVPEIAETDYIRTPVSLLGARQALNIARYSGAERDAAEEYEYAQKSLEQAETAWKSGKEDEDIDVLARQAIAAGVRAEDVATVRKAAREQRNETARRDSEVSKAEDRASVAEKQMEELRAELDRERRNRELAERDTGNASKQMSDLREENQRLRDELAKIRAEADDAKLRLARTEGEKQVIEAQRVAEERAARLRASAPALIQSLKQLGVARETAGGIALTLPENIWAAPRETAFSPVATSKIERLVQILANNPDYKILIESHTDDSGAADALQSLTNERAKMIGDRLITAGINQSRIEAKGLGATLPIVANTTKLNRAKNRRVEIVLSVLNAPQNQTANNQTAQ
jgi:outer membrane protein OmpA-like peptidoglycan-associated protein